VVTDNLTYNGFAEVDSYTANVNATAVFATSFVRDKLGRISQKTETSQGVTHVFDYTYDTAGRLTDVDRDSAPFASYTYDSNGNRLNNGAIYDDQDRLLSQGTATYTYTANGELLTKNDGGQTTYNYDVLGNLISVTLPGGTLIEYVIDGRNRRIGKKVNGTLERAWLYKDSLNPVAELDGTGAVVARFIYGTKPNVPDFLIKGGNTYRIISDHLGSPRLVVDTTTGTVIQTLDYDEWGKVTADTNPEFQPFGFAGGLYDSDTKLVRFGARDYVSETGRWTNKDPIRFAGDGPNLYGYVFGDPVNLFDSRGMFADRVIKNLIKVTNKYYLKILPPVPGKERRGKFTDKKGNDKGAKVFRDGRVVGRNANKIPQGVIDKAKNLVPGVLVFLGDLVDPFDAISGELDGSEDFDLDGNGIPDWQDEFNGRICP
jgi:RHS repeat-associated protein